MDEDLYLPPPENIRKMADGSGLSYKTIKKGKWLPLFNNSFEDLDTTTEEKFGKDVCRIQLNDLFENGFLKEVIQALTSLEEIILKAIEEENEFPDDYNSWFKFGMNIKFFHPDEKGLELFKSISALSPKYKEKECEKFWHSLNPTYGNVGTIVNLIKKEKFVIPKSRKEYLKKICLK